MEKNIKILLRKHTIAEISFILMSEQKDINANLIVSKSISQSGSSAYLLLLNAYIATICNTRINDRHITRQQAVSAKQCSCSTNLYRTTVSFIYII